jgi:hypothetical protein
MLDQLFLAAALLREAAHATTIEQPIAIEAPAPAPHVATPVVVEVQAGNALFPRPAYDPSIANGCSEHDIEAPELDNDGNPCVRIVDNHSRYGDAIVTADDLAPATCDSGTGFWMVTSVWRARQLEQLNPGLVCTPGERYGVTG